MDSSPASCLLLIRAHEGGRVDHPKDPGGRTNKGITQRVYDAYRRSLGLPKRDVWTIEDEEVDDIYVRQYLGPVWYERLPAGLNYAVADFAVNSGVSRAVKELQALVGAKADGVMGVRTLAAVEAAIDGDTDNLVNLIGSYCERRMKFLRRLKHWGTFGKGWTRRVMGRQIGWQAGDHGAVDYAVAMATAAADLAAPRFVGFYEGEVAGAKAEEADLALSRTPEAIGTAAAGAGAIAVALNQVADQLAPIQDTPIVGEVIAVIVPLLGAAASILLVYSAVKNLARRRGEAV